MLTLLLIAVLALLSFAYVAVPLLFPGQADPLPDLSDPVAQDLEEERDALFRAIRELEMRSDLAAERREELRARYEAKAARVLRALDERHAERSGAPRAERSGAPRRVPYGVLTLLGLMVVSAAALSGFVLPRVGDGTVTTFFADELAASRALRELQRNARRDPSEANLLALADAYWRLQDAENAEASYLRISEEVNPVPAIAYRRLGFLALGRDLDEAARYLELARGADPTDRDTLYVLGELRLAQGDLTAAREAWQALAELEPGGAEVAARLELLDAVGPLQERARTDPSKANLLALADAYWQHQEQERAVEVYFRVLTEFDPDSVVALGRTGQLLFTTGRSEDALALLERAHALGGAEAATLLMLGNAHFAAERYQDAIDVWEEYLARGEAEAGRVPDLIASARARLAGAAPGAATGGPVRVSGEELYAANCALCHGAFGQGGSGPQLAGNRRAADRDNVASVIRFGRGGMPGFAGRLDDAHLERLTDYVVGVIAEGAATGGRRP